MAEHKADNVAALPDGRAPDGPASAVTAVTAVTAAPAPQRSGALSAVRPGGGVTSQALAPYLVPQRAGDPLGLGIAPGERPPAPPDPDPYDRERENAEYARSLLNAEARRALDEGVEKGGYMTIEQVRGIVDENTVKGSVEAGGLDPEIMALIDARIDYKIFVAGDNIYTREGLYDHYPFHEFNVQPEAIFVQQEIGIFPPRKHALKDEFEYIARDVGDESVDFVMIEDLVGQAARANYKMKRAPLRVVKTKIYIGKERWEDFALLQRFFRGAVRVATAQIAYGGGGQGGMPPLLAMFSGQAPAPPMIADAATLEAEQLAREEEVRRREEEQRRREEEVQKKIDADLRRVEAMLAAAAGLNTRPGPAAASAAAPAAAAAAAAAPVAPAAAPAAPAAAPATAADDGEEDSVPL